MATHSAHWRRRPRSLRPMDSPCGSGSKDWSSAPSTAVLSPEKVGLLKEGSSAGESASASAARFVFIALLGFEERGDRGTKL